MQVDSQTYKQTDVQTAIVHTPIESKLSHFEYYSVWVAFSLLLKKMGWESITQQ